MPTAFDIETVLLADPSLEERSATQDVLERLGPACGSPREPAEAEQYLSTHWDTSLLGCDVRLGSVRFRFLEGLAGRLHPPVVVTSATPSHGEWPRAIPLGAIGPIPKPVTEDALLRFLRGAS